MSLHKLTAGDGYSYLTRQVAAMDSTEMGGSLLESYYSAKGESPGVWLGSGLEALAEMDAATAVMTGDTVTSEQMRALFGEGRHPNAEAIERELRDAAIDAGSSTHVAVSEGLVRSRLGRPFPVHSGESELRKAIAQAFADYNAGRGEKETAAIDPAVRAEIRTHVAGEKFAAEYGRGPIDDRELSGFVAKGTRQKTTAVAGYDLTFSPVKSVSTLWAIAPREVSEAIVEAHDAAVRTAMNFVEKKAALTRTGHAGIAQVDTLGLLATAFTHRDSRAGDPDLHTHVAVSNKVPTRGADGQIKWLALDGRAMYKANVAASEVYNTAIEHELAERLGVQFAARDSGVDGKRVVREIVGVDDQLNAVWSSRRAAIDQRRSELAADFQARHGRVPTATEHIHLAQQANLETRQAKHEPRSLAEQRAAWRAGAVRVLGGEEQLSAMVLGATSQVPQPAAAVTDEWVEMTAQAVVAAVAEDRSRWQETHIIAETQRRIRSSNVAPNDAGEAVERVAAAALGEGHSIALGPDEDFGEPAALRRKDGASVYTVAGSRLYTSQEVLDREERIVTAARTDAGRGAETIDVELALLESAANGRELNSGQAALVREMATSGRQVQLALAPAGSGKTTAMATLATAWTNSGGTVLGLAPTAAAAAALRADLGAPTDTIGKLTHSLATAGGDTALPVWLHNVGPDTLVIVDEAGMASTRDLDAVIGFVASRGGQVRLVGDDQQLASVQAGGVLRDIAADSGAITLRELVRFTEPDEAAATLALRDGDTAATGFYIDHGRLHVGGDIAAEQLAYNAWRRDHDSGYDAVLLAPTTAMVDRLNAQARTDRIAADGPPDGPSVTLADGLDASAGDVIRTCRNDRRLTLGQSDFVRNGDRWTIDSVGVDGSLTVTRIGEHPRTQTLPADYVAASTRLGYARTIHAAQGLTADRCHAVATGAESRQLAYVALTRGRGENHIYFTAPGDGDPETAVHRTTLLPPTGTDLLAGVIARDGAEKSATTTARDAADPHTRLVQAAGAYADAVGMAAEAHLGDGLNDIDKAAGKIDPRILDDDAYPVLRKRLAIIAVAEDRDPAAVLADAARGRELASAENPAAVLGWRIDPTGQGRTKGTRSARPGPLPWLPALPEALAGKPEWGEYLIRRAEHVQHLAAQVRTDAQAWDAATAPRWAGPLAAAGERRITGELAVWRAAHGVDDADRRPTGPPQYAVADRREQDALDTRCEAVLGSPAGHVSRWAPLAEKIAPRLRDDPFWPDLAERFTVARRAGIDVHALAAAAVSARPLPDDMPAAALWWRLAGRLDQSAAGGAQPPVWDGELGRIFGPVRADIVRSDPAYTRLAAAIDAADPARWAPGDLLAIADAMLTAGQDDAADPGRDYARSLAWRVEGIVDHTPVHEPDPGAEPGDLVGEEAAATIAGRWPEDGGRPHDAELARRPQPARAEHHAAAESGADWQPTDADIPVDPEMVPPDPAGADWQLTDTDIPAPAEVEADNVAAARHDAPFADEPYAHLPAGEQAILLAADVEAARTRYERLAAAAEAGAGVHQRAAGALVADLATRADAQRPHAAAVAEAHHTWMIADRDAETADAEVARLATLAAGERAAAATDREAGETTSADEHELAAAGAEADHSLAGLRAAAARSQADEAADRYRQARARLVAAAGGAGGVVTGDDAQAARRAAADLDGAEVIAARRDYTRLAGALQRAERAAARDYAASSDPLDHGPAQAGSAPVAVLTPPETQAVTEVHTPAETADPLASLAADYRRTLDALDRARVHAVFATVLDDPAAVEAITDAKSSWLVGDAIRKAQRIGIDAADVIAPTVRDAAAAAEADSDPAGITRPAARDLHTACVDTRTDWLRRHSAVLSEHIGAARDGLDDQRWDTVADILMAHGHATGQSVDEMAAALGTRVGPTAPVSTIVDTLRADPPHGTIGDTPAWIGPPPEDATTIDPALAETARRQYDGIAAEHAHLRARAGADLAGRDRPEWARTLGDRPDDARLAGQWDAAAADAQLYRRMYGVTDQASLAGPEPASGPRHQQRSYAQVQAANDHQQQAQRDAAAEVQRRQASAERQARQRRDRPDPDAERRRGMGM